jgi:CheY-like chemotaxis protein
VLPSEPIILIVDDDVDTHFVLGRTLVKAEIPNVVVCCDSGAEALAYFQKCLQGMQPWPGMVFLDIKMPGLSGFDVLKWLRAKEALGSTVIAMITTSNEPRDVHTSFSLGAHTMLNKGVSPEVLGPIVRSALKLGGRKSPELL